jgi:hypothetical protein
MQYRVAIAGKWGSAPMPVERDLSSASSNGKESLQSLCAILLSPPCSVSEQAAMQKREGEQCMAWHR